MRQCSSLHRKQQLGSSGSAQDVSKRAHCWPIKVAVQWLHVSMWHMPLAQSAFDVQCSPLVPPPSIAAHTCGATGFRVSSGASTATHCWSGSKQLLAGSLQHAEHTLSQHTPDSHSAS